MRTKILLLFIGSILPITGHFSRIFLRYFEKNDVEKCLSPQIPKMSVDKSLRMIYNSVHKRTNVPISERR